MKNKREKIFVKEKLTPYRLPRDAISEEDYNVWGDEDFS